MSDREFDVVVYGATGFTGGLVCDYLASKRVGAFRWAIAGRSGSKLEEVRRRVQESGGHNVEIIVASKEEASQWTGRTRVVISTAGPFMLYGRELVAACVESATSYVDSTGELPFVKDNVEAYQEEARQKGIHIISCCGYDSIPSDVTTWCAVRKLQDRGVVDVETVEVEQTAQGGSVSGGTLASMFNLLETPHLLRESSAPFI